MSHHLLLHLRCDKLRSSKNKAPCTVAFLVQIDYGRSPSTIDREASDQENGNERNGVLTVSSSPTTTIPIIVGMTDLVQNSSQPIYFRAISLYISSPLFDRGGVESNRKYDPHHRRVYECHVFDVTQHVDLIAAVDVLPQEKWAQLMSQREETLIGIAGFNPHSLHNNQYSVSLRRPIYYTTIASAVRGVFTSVFTSPTLSPSMLPQDPQSLPASHDDEIASISSPSSTVSSSSSPHSPSPSPPNTSKPIPITARPISALSPELLDPPTTTISLTSSSSSQTAGKIIIDVERLCCCYGENDSIASCTFPQLSPTFSPFHTPPNICVTMQFMVYALDNISTLTPPSPWLLFSRQNPGNPSHWFPIYRTESILSSRQATFYPFRLRLPISSLVHPIKVECKTGKENIITIGETMLHLRGVIECLQESLSEKEGGYKRTRKKKEDRDSVREDKPVQIDDRADPPSYYLLLKNENDSLQTASPIAARQLRNEDKLMDRRTGEWMSEKNAMVHAMQTTLQHVLRARDEDHPLLKKADAENKKENIEHVKTTSSLSSSLHSPLETTLLQSKESKPVQDVGLAMIDVCESTRGSISSKTGEELSQVEEGEEERGRREEEREGVDEKKKEQEEQGLKGDDRLSNVSTVAGSHFIEIRATERGIDKEVSLQRTSEATRDSSEKRGGEENEGNSKDGDDENVEQFHFDNINMDFDLVKADCKPEIVLKASHGFLKLISLSGFRESEELQQHEEKIKMVGVEDEERRDVVRESETSGILTELENIENKEDERKKLAQNTEGDHVVMIGKGDKGREKADVLRLKQDKLDGKKVVLKKGVVGYEGDRELYPSSGKVGWQFRLPGFFIIDRSHEFLELYAKIGNKDEHILSTLSHNLGGNSITIMCIKGFLGDYFPGYFSSVKKHLRRLGYDAQTIPVRTSSTSVENSIIIRDAVLRLPAGKKAVLIGHSKGGLDSSMALTLFPELRNRVFGLITVQSPIGGSPIAQDFAHDPTIARFFNFALKSVLSGDPLSMQQISYTFRRSFMSIHPWPINTIPTVCFASHTGSRLSVMWGTHKFVQYRYGAKSDGLVCPVDSFLPGSVAVELGGVDHTQSVISTAMNCKYNQGQLIEVLLYMLVEESNRLFASEEYKE